MIELLESVGFQRLLFALVLPSLVPASGLYAKHPFDSPRYDEIKLSDLKEPPENIRKLIEQGDVKLFRGTPPSTGSRNSFSPAARAYLDAETHYRMSFDFRFRKRWNVDQLGTRRVLKIQIDIQRVRVTQHHGIWFKRPPSNDRFWEDKLVLHEFDHVLISSDPKVEKLFVSKLRQAAQLTKELAPGQRFTAAQVDQIVREHANDVFDEVLDLVGIRYRELDRVTRNGKIGLPRDSELLRWR